MAGETIGAVVVCDITRSEDDTDDINAHLNNADGSNAVVIGWTATLRIAVGANDAPLATFTGIGIAGGDFPIDMALFALAIGSYKYDIRVIDTVTPDTPARVYWRGNFKVTQRIN